MFKSKVKDRWHFMEFKSADNCDVCGNIIAAGKKAWVRDSGARVCHGCKCKGLDRIKQ